MPPRPALLARALGVLRELPRAVGVLLEGVLPAPPLPLGAWKALCCLPLAFAFVGCCSAAGCCLVMEAARA